MHQMPMKLQRMRCQRRRSCALRCAQMSSRSWRWSGRSERIEKAVQSGGAASGEVLEHYGDILYRAGDAEGALLKWKEAQRLGGASDAIGRKVAEGRLPD